MATKRNKPSRGYVSVSEAAERVGVSRVTIWRWIRAGRIEVVRLGHRTVRIPDDFDRRLASNAGSSAPSSHGPLARGARVADGEHVAQFYEQDASLVSAVATFLRASLGERGSAIVIATEGHREAIRERLAATGLDPRALGDRYVELDARETLLRLIEDGMPDPARFARVVGDAVRRANRRPPLRAYGEMVGLLAAGGEHAAALRLEQLWNDLLRRESLSLLCGYPLDRLGGSAVTTFIESVCDEHSRIVPAEEFTRLRNEKERMRAIVTMQHELADEAAAVEAAGE